MLKYKKVITYGVIGVFGTSIHFSTLVLMVEFFGIDPIISSITGFVLTVIISFFLNKNYTFNAHSENRIYLFIKYFVVSLCGLFLNSFTMYFTIKILSLHYLIGQVIVVVFVPIINFSLNYFWTFRYANNYPTK
jgi:putative flippase GtrA